MRQWHSSARGQQLTNANVKPTELRSHSDPSLRFGIFDVVLLFSSSMRAFSFPIFLLAIALAGCGTPGAPLPPSLGIPKPVGDLEAIRKGNSVTLTWSAPTDTTDGSLVRKTGKMLVSRSISSGSRVGAAEVVAQVPLESALKEPEPPSPTAKDSLSSVLDTANDFVVYTVVAQSNLGKSAGPSNVASVPLVPTPPAPARLQATAVPQGISLSWDQPSPRENRSRLTAQYGWRVMRREEGTPAPVIVKQIDLGNETARFVDSSIEWQKHYDYWIAPITLWQGDGKKGVVEGDNSPVASVFANDVFPPDAPVGLQAVYSGLADQPSIDLAWTPSTEPDLAGYNVYRHTGDEPPVKVNSALVKTSAYRDTQVKLGVKYFYSVSAVDLRNNESNKSEEASESVPQ
jgi:hypothetical protein